MQPDDLTKGASIQDLLHLSMSGLMISGLARNHLHHVASVHPDIAQAHHVSSQHLVDDACVGSQSVAGCRSEPQARPTACNGL
eukprot:6019376-Lingulodinium_polyedra.AAC.1